MGKSIQRIKMDDKQGHLLRNGRSQLLISQRVREEITQRCKRLANKTKTRPIKIQISVK